MSQQSKTGEAATSEAAGVVPLTPEELRATETGVRSHKRKLLKAADEPAGQTTSPCQRGSACERDSGRPELML